MNSLDHFVLFEWGLAVRLGFGGGMGPVMDESAPG